MGSAPERLQNLVAGVNKRTGANLFSNTFTISFARRATTWKRANLLFHDMQRLLALHANRRPRARQRWRARRPRRQICPGSVSISP